MRSHLWGHKESVGRHLPGTGAGPDMSNQKDRWRRGVHRARRISWAGSSDDSQDVMLTARATSH